MADSRDRLARLLGTDQPLVVDVYGTSDDGRLATRVNKFHNPSFESIYPSAGASYYSGNAMDDFRDSSISRSGGHSLGVVTNGAGGGVWVCAAGTNISGPDSAVSVVPGASYLLTAWVRRAATSGIPEARLAAILYNQDFSTILSTFYSPMTTLVAGTWQRLTAWLRAVNVPPDARWAQVVLTSDPVPQTSGKTMNIDHMSFEVVTDRDADAQAIAHYPYFDGAYTDDPDVVGAWQGTAHDSPSIAFVGDTMPADMLSTTTIRRGRDFARDEAEADTMSAVVVGGLTSGDRTLSVGRPIRLRLSDEALVTLFGSATSSDALAARARFTGQISDLGDIQLAYGQDVMQVPVTAAGLYARLSSGSVIGLVPWVAGTSDVKILTDTLDQAWVLDPGLRMAEWQSDPIPWRAPAAARTPVPAARRFITWDIDAQAPAQVISDLVESTDGVPIERRDGSIDWLTPENRRALPVYVTLDASQILSPATVSQTINDLVDQAEVSYGDPDLNLQVITKDQAALDDHGIYKAAPRTRLATSAAAAELGRDLVGRYGWPTWRLPSITVDITQLIEDGDLTTARALLTAETGFLVEIAGLPTTSPVAAGYFWVEGTDETITSARWQMTLRTSAFALLAPPVRWNEVPSSVRWTDVPDTVTWIGATGYQPDPFPVASYRTTQANLRWNQLAATSWADYERTS